MPISSLYPLPDTPDRHLHIGVAELLQHLHHAEAAGGELLGVEGHAQLQLFAAGDLHLRYAGDGRELVGQRLVGVVVNRIDRQVAGQHDCDHRGRVGVELQDFRRFRGGGEVFFHLVDPFAHIHRGDVDRLSELEFQQDLADILHAGGFHRLEAVDGADRILQTFRDIDLDLGGAGPRIDGGDGHIRNLDVRKGVQPDLVVAAQPEQHQHDDQTGHRDGTDYGSVG